MARTWSEGSNSTWIWPQSASETSTTEILSSSDSSIRNYTTLQYLLGTVYALIILLSLLGNAAVILTVMMFQQLKTLNHYLLTSLAAADLTVTILVMPFALIQDISGEWSQSRTFCFFWMSWDVMCCTASLQHLCAVAWDRYVAISDPYGYDKRMNITKVTLMILSIWIVSALISFLPIFMGWFSDEIIDDVGPRQCFLETNPFYAIASALISFYLPFTGMAYCYFKIFAIVRQKIRMNFQQRSFMRNSLRAALMRVGGPGSETERTVDSSRNNSNSGINMRDLKATKTLGIVFGMFFFCWWPFFILYWVDAFLTPSYIPQPVHSIITWLGYLNSALNPIIYSWNPIFRAAYKQLFCYMVSPCSRETYAMNGLLTPSPSDFTFKLNTRNHSNTSGNTTGFGVPTEEDIKELELIFWPPQRPLFRQSTCGEEENCEIEVLENSNFHLTVNECTRIRRRSYVMPGENDVSLYSRPCGKSHEFEDGMEALLRSRTITTDFSLC